MTCCALCGWHVGSQARNPEEMKSERPSGLEWTGLCVVFSVKYDYHLEHSWRIVRKQVEWLCVCFTNINARLKTSPISFSGLYSLYTFIVALATTVITGFQGFCSGDTSNGNAQLPFEIPDFAVVSGKTNIFNLASTKYPLESLSCSRCCVERAQHQFTALVN